MADMSRVLNYIAGTIRNTLLLTHLGLATPLLASNELPLKLNQFFSFLCS